MERYRLTREVPTLREREIASVARYERLFTRYLLGHFDERDHHDGNDDPLLAEVAASAVVTAHNHVLRRWLRAGGRGDVEAQLDHAFAIVRETFGSGIGAGRPAPSAASSAAPEETAPAAPAVRASTAGDVVVAVARTDAPSTRSCAPSRRRSAPPEPLLPLRGCFAVWAVPGIRERPTRRLPRSERFGGPIRSIIAHV